MKDIPIGDSYTFTLFYKEGAKPIKGFLSFGFFGNFSLKCNDRSFISFIDETKEILRNDVLVEGLTFNKSEDETAMSTGANPLQAYRLKPGTRNILIEKTIF